MDDEERLYLLLAMRDESGAFLSRSEWPESGAIDCTRASRMVSRLC